MHDLVRELPRDRERKQREHPGHLDGLEPGGGGTTEGSTDGSGAPSRFLADSGSASYEERPTGADLGRSFGSGGGTYSFFQMSRRSIAAAGNPATRKMTATELASPTIATTTATVSATRPTRPKLVGPAAVRE